MAIAPHEPSLGEVFGEDYSKSPSLAEWGMQTLLAITVPLAGEHWLVIGLIQMKTKLVVNSAHIMKDMEHCVMVRPCVYETIRITIICRFSSTSHYN